jgi:hypothetical protein
MYTILIRVKLTDEEELDIEHVIFFELQRQRGASETADDEATQGEEGKQNTRESFHCLSQMQSYCMGSEPKKCSLLCFFHWLFLLLLALSAPVEGFSILCSQQPSPLQMNMATMNTAAPLYITVGPQCAGKPTFLTQLERRLSTTIEDITLDEQLDIYVQVPTEYFLQKEEEGMNNSFLQRGIQGKMLASRIYDLESNGELRAILVSY